VRASIVARITWDPTHEAPPFHLSPDDPLADLALSDFSVEG
jgi:hypothetical protein